MRFFNTSGPVVAQDHYCIPPLERVNLDKVLRLVGNKRYFVMHAPRQTGKTATLLALRDLPNSDAQGAEAGPQLLLQAFLQRGVNSGGRIEREYGLGRGRTDLLIVWPQEGREAPESSAGKWTSLSRTAAARAAR